MNNIMISYRREDTLPYCDTLDRALVSYFGRERVFRDMMRMVPGQDWKSQLGQAIAQSAVQLVLIGPQWLQPTSPGGTRRIDAPDDPVRAEIELAQQRGIQIIPILIEKALMPDAASLPPSIAFLTGLHALPLRSGLDDGPDIQRITLQILTVAPQTTPRFDPGATLARAEQPNVPPDWRVWRARSNLLIVTPSGVVQGNAKTFDAIDFSAVQHLDMATRTKTFRRGVFIGPIQIAGSPWPEVKTDVVLPLILRDGTTLDWIIGPQFPDHASIAQAIKATYDRFMMSRQGVGVPAVGGYEVGMNAPGAPGGFSPPGALATASYAAPVAQGSVGSFAQLSSTGATMRTGRRPVGGTSLALGLITVLLSIAFARYGWRIVNVETYLRLVQILPLILSLLAGFIATLRTRRLSASLLTGFLIVFGSALYDGSILLSIQRLPVALLQREGVILFATFVVAFVGGLLGAFINLFRR
jgi:TIR domain